MPSIKNFEKIFLGIDPGFAITGFGVIGVFKSNFYPVDYGCILTSSDESFDCRLKKIYDKTKKIIRKYSPDYICIEDLFFCNNVKTAIKVGQARGIIILCSIQSKIPIYEFTPLEVKQSITGYGRADKKQIQHMIKSLLNLSEIPKPDDAADALAIAFCGATSHKMLTIKNK